MSYKAYQTVSEQAEDPRSTEYRLFGEVTRALLEIKDLDRFEIGRRATALDRNRKVWNALALDCASDDNQLPDSLRASIISLSIFVSKETSKAMRGEGDVDFLIELNRTIMQGLAPAGDSSAA